MKNHKLIKESTSEDIKNNLIKSVSKIGTVLATQESQFFNNLKISIQDRDISKDNDTNEYTLNMVLIGLEFSYYGGAMLEEVSEALQDVIKKIDKTLVMFTLDNKGNLRPKNTGTIKFLGGVMVDKLTYNQSDEELHFSIDCMFTELY